MTDRISDLQKNVCACGRDEQKERIIRRIIREEWIQFQKVHNRGGRADCQDSPDTFYSMRASQFKAWTLELLDSYYRDLTDAAAGGENLLFQKYAYMMKYTAPEEFEGLRRFLPEITPEKKQMIREISEIHLAWTKEFDRDFPYIAGRGRPETLDRGDLGITSFQTYLEGELATYGDRTLSLYYDYTMHCKKEHINLTRVIREYSVRDAGFESLDQAEKLIQRH